MRQIGLTSKNSFEYNSLAEKLIFFPSFFKHFILIIDKRLYLYFLKHLFVCSSHLCDVLPFFIIFLKLNLFDFLSNIWLKAEKFNDQTIKFLCGSIQNTQFYDISNCKIFIQLWWAKCHDYFEKKSRIYFLIFNNDNLMHLHLLLKHILTKNIHRQRILFC